ncbi:MAG: hypothetical protein U9M89_01200 [Patescibacteria group bacterium]|nr:hypothetical protein [Patescibacteria group bacterium]
MVRKAFIFILTILVITLGGCNWRLDVGSPNADNVLARMTHNLSETETFAFAGDFSLNGPTSVSLFSGLSNLEIDFFGESNVSSVRNMQYGIELTLSGTGDEGATEVGMELRNFPDSDFFRIKHLSLPLSLPFTLSTDQRWYKVGSNTPESSDILGGVNKLTNAELKELRGLISESKIFEVTEQLGDATVNGSRTFHYKVGIDSLMVEEILYKWLTITDSDKVYEVPDWVEMLKTYDYEIFINKHSFDLAQIKVSGWYLDARNQRLEFTTNIIFDRFNNRVDIPRPSDVEDFNLRSLLGV